jgi:formylglycine-generating enzyme required for sulfatase activity
MRNRHNLTVGPGVLCVLALLFAGCPGNVPEDSGGDGVYQVQTGILSLGEIEAWPGEGPEGTEIELGLYPDEDCAFVPGTLYYRALPEGGKAFVPDGGYPIVFSLPASDVEVGAEFRDIAALSRRTVPVPGSTVGKKTGRAGAPFFSAGTSPVTVEGFRLAATMVPYQLWHDVRVWAENPERGAMKYSLPENSGKEGTSDRSGSSGIPLPTKAHRYDPVVSVSWRDAVVWCNAYSDWDREVNGAPYEPVYKKDGAVLRESSPSTPVPEKPAFDAPGYRLATEAEWEFAARGGDPALEAWTFQYPGSNNVDEVAWHGDMTCWVGLKAPNDLGLYDMGGNAREWCWDMHSGASRVSRGIALDDRYGINSTNIGFRVTCPLD